MTEARPYYTDPLAAAWMMQKHGIEFENVSNINEVLDPPLDGKFFIRANSVKLLEPQQGDLCRSESGTHGLYRVPLEPSGVWFDGMNLKIIQRNGIAFIWPEFGQ